MLLKFAALLAALPLLVAAFPVADPVAKTEEVGLLPFGTFAEKTVFVPPRNYTVPRTLYARTVQLGNGVLLATWENYSPEPPKVYFPIYQSIDGGETWRHLSDVTDQVNGWGMRYQPFLYELPEQIGIYPAGTVLCAGNSIPQNLSSTKVDVYASRDQGLTWNFVSSVASGGEALPDNGLTPVWEPFLMVYKNQLVCYYSDQRDPQHGQKLVHQVSIDLKSWGPTVDDVAYPTYTDRPGMTTIALLPNGSYIMTYEYGGGPGFSGYSFPVYYRISDSPLTFNSAIGHPVQAGKLHPTSSPYVVWTPVGGIHGTIAVSSGTYSQIFVNKKLGDPNSWEAVATPQDVAYTRHLRVMNNNPGHLLIMGGGRLGGSTNNVSLSVIELS